MRVVAVAVVLTVACAGCLGRTSVGECTYEKLPAKCGELLVQLDKNYRTDELHPLTRDLRDLIAKEGGSIVHDDDDLGVIVTKFDLDDEKLARMLDRLFKPPCNRSQLTHSKYPSARNRCSNTSRSVAAANLACT